MKQGCVLAPSPFNQIFTAMLTDAFRDDDVGISIRYQTDGMVFNLRRLQTKTKVVTDISRDFLFADDCALNSRSEADMQRSVDKFSDARNDVGLSISINKTEAMHLPAPGKPYVELSVTEVLVDLAYLDVACISLSITNAPVEYCSIKKGGAPFVLFRRISKGPSRK